MHDVFFFTDIHGMYDLYRAIIDYCIEQDPECVIVFGGDACDRGPHGYKIMHELLAHPQVIYLKGNHEEIFVDAAKELREHFVFNNPTRYEVMERLGIAMHHGNEFPHITNCIYNGGIDTLTDWILDGMPMDFVEAIDNLQYTASCLGVDMCHAGSVYNVFSRVQNAEYNEQEIDKLDKNCILWDRDLLRYGWAPNRTCVFGHTPTPHIIAKFYGKDKSLDKIHPCAYVGDFDERLTGRKIDMDTAASGTGIAYVLNIFTMKAQGFKDTEFLNDEIHKHDVKKIDCIQL